MEDACSGCDFDYFSVIAKFHVNSKDSNEQCLLFLKDHGILSGHPEI